MPASTFELCALHRDQDVVAHGSAGDRTMADLLADAAKVAKRLEHYPRGGEVAIVCHDRYDFAAALVGALDRGLVVALPPNARPETLKLLRSGGSVLTVLSDQVGAAGIEVRRVLAEGDTGQRAARPLLPASRRIVVVYTSGSTGVPTACPKTAAQLVGEAQVLSRTFGLGARDAVVSTVPPHHIYGLLFSVLVPLVSGGAFAAETPFHADAVRGVIARDRARVLVSVPAHLRALSIMERQGTETLTRIFSSGAPLPDQTRADLGARFGWRVTEVLGSSETGGIGHRDEAGAPFTTFDGVEVGAGDDERMRVLSPFLPPDAPRPFVTGDRVELLSPRSFRHLGRSDGVIKIGSTRVSVAELEDRLTSIPGVREAAVLTVSAAGGRGQETWAVLAVEPGAPLDASGVRERLHAWLDPVVVPRRFRFVSELLRESTGKISRERLLALFDGEGRGRG